MGAPAGVAVAWLLLRRRGGDGRAVFVTDDECGGGEPLDAGLLEAAAARAAGAVAEAFHLCVRVGGNGGWVGGMRW